MIQRQVFAELTRRFVPAQVFCCEVDGIFNTLLDDAELLDLLFSLLNQVCSPTAWRGSIKRSLHRMMCLRGGSAVVAVLVVFSDAAELVTLPH